MRKAGNRLRITAQLIDAATGNHLWAERFDCEATDIFAIQDEMTEKVVGSSSRNFSARRGGSAKHKPTESGRLGTLLRARLRAFWQGDRRRLASGGGFSSALSSSIRSMPAPMACLAQVQMALAYHGWLADRDRIRGGRGVAHVGPSSSTRTMRGALRQGCWSPHETAAYRGARQPGEGRGAQSKLRTGPFAPGHHPEFPWPAGRRH